MIGANTSPLGVILFVMMEVAKIPFNHMIRAFMPFYVPLIILLILITFFPTISLWLPRLIEGLQASGALEPKPLVKVELCPDLVLCTHDHLDHLGPATVYKKMPRGWQ